jgi:hypothetical protein
MILNKGRVSVAAAIAIAYLSLSACDSAPRSAAATAKPSESSSIGAASAVAGQLDERTVEALHEALDDERHAIAFYTAVIDKFGNVRPFVNIVRAEERHEAALLRLFAMYDLDVPKDRWTEHEFDVPDTRAAACAASVDAEIENIAMYDRFLEFVEEPYIRQVFQNLRAASADRHLPAFQRCARR